MFEFYDPFANTIVHSQAGVLPKGRIHVPLLFTQSGIKPLTSLEMSCRYVSLYDRFTEADAVVACGYGFNGDDGHINCLFRNLIESGGKDVFVLDFARGAPRSNARAAYCRKLRLRVPSSKLHVIPVGLNRATPSGEPWYRAVAQRLLPARSPRPALAASQTGLDESGGHHGDPRPAATELRERGRVRSSQ